MDMYPTYESAKIANPECDIYEHNCTPMGRLFTPGLMHSVMNGSYNKKCNPADHCMTVEKFLADGYKFVDGDAYLDRAGDIEVVGKLLSVSVVSEKGHGDEYRYILRAAALETKEPKRTKESYEKVELTRKEFACELIEGNSLYTPDKRVELYFDEFSGKMKGKNSKGLSWDVVIDHGTYLRRIETPIEWWEDANDLLGDLANLSLDDDGVLQLTMEKGQVGFGMSRDKWCDFARILLEQGE
ncbi:hypothetical protein NVP1247A_11 [Vibrio phage 1.247.A._10N.261.54.E12]|nr:hypothetical protein NVP1247A_11 [Vibrio phage 1.247.A._10N.261.54.E12]AUR98155.1 hypothetical protein NVP1247B_11 [Vibrio phage 1.247.B._10N.261.54.E12]